MTIQSVKRVCIAIGMSCDTLHPVVRTRVDDLPVIDSDPAHIFVKIGKGRGAISKRFHLHPLNDEDKRNDPPRGPYSFEMGHAKAEQKMFCADQTEVLLKYTHAYCRPGFEDELLASMIVSAQSSMRAGAGFLLDCIDQLQNENNKS